MTLQDATAYARLVYELRGDVHDESDNAATLQMLENEYRLMEQRYQAKPGIQLFGPDGITVLCWECEQPIPKGRLSVVPNATFCVDCQRVIEQRQKQEGR